MAEGFDIYSAGSISNAYPWKVVNSSYNGSIVSSAGKFGGNKLAFTSTNTSPAIGTSYNFPSTVTMTRTGGTAFIAFSGWIFVDAVTTTGNYKLVSVGSSSDTSKYYDILGVSRSSTGDLTLIFPSNIQDITSSPVAFPVTASNSYWVDIKIAWYPTGNMTASYEINGGKFTTDRVITWATDSLGANATVNMFHFWSSSVYSWGIDDMIIQNCSSFDANWSMGTMPVSSNVPSLGPRQIFPVTVTGNGSQNDWESSNNNVPNYQAATNGTDSISTQTSGAIDLYTVAVDSGILDVSAVIVRGSGQKPGNVLPIAKSGSTLSTSVSNGGGTEFVGILETNNGTQWTASSINSGEFGLKGL